MTERAQSLRRQIALYRSYLADGVDAEVARKYLIEIKKLEAELTEIENDPNKRI